MSDDATVCETTGQWSTHSKSPSCSPDTFVYLLQLSPDSHPIAHYILARFQTIVFLFNSTGGSWAVSITSTRLFFRPFSPRAQLCLLSGKIGTSQIDNQETLFHFFFFFNVSAFLKFKNDFCFKYIYIYFEYVCCLEIQK